MGIEPTATGLKVTRSTTELRRLLNIDTMSTATKPFLQRPPIAMDRSKEMLLVLGLMFLVVCSTSDLSVLHSTANALASSTTYEYCIISRGSLTFFLYDYKTNNQDILFV